LIDKSLFEMTTNVRSYWFLSDVFWRGKCDDGCYALADELGWGV